MKGANYEKSKNHKKYDPIFYFRYELIEFNNRNKSMYRCTVAVTLVHEL